MLVFISPGEGVLLEQKDGQDHRLSTFLNPTVCRGKQAEPFLFCYDMEVDLWQPLPSPSRWIRVKKSKEWQSVRWLTTPPISEIGKVDAVSKCGSYQNCFVIWGSWYNSFLLLFLSQCGAILWAFLFYFSESTGSFIYKLNFTVISGRSSLSFYPIPNISFKMTYAWLFLFLLFIRC